MLSKLDHVSDTHTRGESSFTLASTYSTVSPELRQKYITSSEAASAIQEVIDAQLEDTPHRLINTITGRLCNRVEQIIAFKMSPKYKGLLSSTMQCGYTDLWMVDIKNTVEMYFSSVMLSHRWEENEPPLRHIQGKDIYKLEPVGGIRKLQSFCKTARDTGYRWAWVDTCCIDQTNNVEVQQSVNSMFVWYRHSALTIIYLLDVPPSSKSGALAKSVWNQRGWTVQEFLAPKFVRFYQSDWTLYLNDCSRNHKDSAVIMQELGDATGIDPQALVAFRPGMRGAREKLRWVSTRITTLQEDIAYSLFGIFGIHLPVIYGENKQNALGRLLQEIIAKSGDITCLDWVGKPSEFNSCLPASIASYGTDPSVLSSQLSEGEMQTSVSSLRDTVDAKLASRLYQRLESLNAPRFAASQLRLPCIVFTVTSVRRRRGEDQQPASTFMVKADGLRDLLITTEDKLIQFSGARPFRKAILLVRPWDHSLLEVPDPADLPYLSDSESEVDLSPPASPLRDSPVGSLGENGLVDHQIYSRALRLIVRLGQPFSVFLLAQQPGGEYKRIASDQSIIAQVHDMTAVDNMMDVRTLEIL
jgi:hypothetical protein